mgnify:CR=1 FL=1
MALSQYLENNYDAVKGIARNIAPGDYDDLCHEVIIQLYDIAEEKITPLIESGAIRFWIVRIMLNNYRSKTSRYHYKFRRHVERHRELAHFIREWSEPTEWEIREGRFEAIENAIENVPWFDAVVFSIYYDQGHSLNTLAAETGISRHTIYSTIKRTKDEIKKQTKGTR